MGPDHQTTSPEKLEIAILNSKGFGGNNASAVVLSPGRTEAMLSKRYGESAMKAYFKRREASVQASENYLSAADKGEYAPIYRFGEDMIDEANIEISETCISIKGFANSISLPTDNHYQDMTD
jgi:acetoacetyl-[acyl-carrier protein] synthase